MKVPDGNVELGDHVHVAVRTRLVPGDRAEDGQAPDTEGTKLGSVRLDPANGLGALHGSIIRPTTAARHESAQPGGTGLARARAPASASPLAPLA